MGLTRWTSERGRLERSIAEARLALVEAEDAIHLTVENQWVRAATNGTVVSVSSSIAARNWLEAEVILVTPE